ncbi:hypothetical protein cyc_03147 [Cyclospora cayetanensis]|uniref:Protein MEMO1 n=1 Tax=Cyclospora cayetanensis TaxID=88456 RepID=A0A1D3D7A0_9EIME|nr:hypothetical protein cyc_03147 [Cyclospora cayetanensis]
MELTRRSGGRRAAHAGTWYDADCTSLKSQLHCWLDSSSKICDGRIKALICPKRIFLLGPSHYKYFIGVALPPKHCEEYLTPLGGLSLDTEVLEAFRSNGTFCELSPAEDEEEHSLELMLPFIRHIFPEGIKIIPMIVGELRQQEECQKFADVLIDYFLHDENLFIISSDFCHWGPRYAYYYLEEPLANLPIHLSIETGRKGEKKSEIGGRINKRKAEYTASTKYGERTVDWQKGVRQRYQETVTTLCVAADGQKCYQVYNRAPEQRLFQLLGDDRSFDLRELLDTAAARNDKGFSTKLIAYSQSSHAMTRNDSSVSYASLCTTRVSC